MTRHRHPCGRAARLAYAERLEAKALGKADKAMRKAERTQRIDRARQLEALRLSDLEAFA